MDHQVNIQQLSTLTGDGQGGRTGSHATVATVWAAIIPLSVSKSLSYGIPLKNKAYEISMAYDPDVTLTEDDILEVVETGQVLYIDSVIDVDKKYNQWKVLATQKR